MWVTQDRESVGFWDAAAREEVKKKGQGAIEKWIDEQRQRVRQDLVCECLSAGAPADER